MRRVGVQSACLGLEEIEDDAIILKGGERRAVLEVGSVNFALQDEREQEAIVLGFAAFLNSLTFPIQILVRGLPVDVAGYLDALERRSRELPDLLGDLAHDHIAYVARLARSRTLLERRFYVVVAARSELTHRGLLSWRTRSPAGPDVASLRRLLTHRCAEVERQLGRCGLSARRLDDAELASLLYAVWCPDLARSQRLSRQPGHAPFVVTAASNSTQRNFRRST